MALKSFKLQCPKSQQVMNLVEVSDFFLTVNSMIDLANNYGHCLFFKHVIALKSTALYSFKLQWPESQQVMNLVEVSEFFLQLMRWYIQQIIMDIVYFLNM